MRYLIAYLITAIVFLGIDALWLTRVALGMYRRELGGLLRDKPSLGISGVFYLLYALGIVVLAVLPAVTGGGWVTALWMGAVLGVAAYGTYDMTNLATLKGWPARLSLIDLCWGTALTAVSAAAATAVVTWFNL